MAMTPWEAAPTHQGSMIVMELRVRCGDSRTRSKSVWSAITFSSGSALPHLAKPSWRIATAVGEEERVTFGMSYLTSCMAHMVLCLLRH